MVELRWITKPEGRGRPRVKKLDLSGMQTVQKAGMLDGINVSAEAYYYHIAAKRVFVGSSLLEGLTLYGYKRECLKKNNYVKFFTTIGTVRREPAATSHRIAVYPQERDAAQLLTQLTGERVSIVIIEAYREISRYKNRQRDLYDEMVVQIKSKRIKADIDIPEYDPIPY